MKKICLAESLEKALKAHDAWLGNDNEESVNPAELPLDITRLSYWFPKIKAAGLQVPETCIIKTTEKELKDIFRSMESSRRDGVYSLAKRIGEAIELADGIDYPCFLRTDHFSGKHDWERTCFVQNGESIAEHIMAIAYMWECMNMFGPPCDVWVIREFLPTKPVGVCHSYGDMPICREFRFFVEDGDIKCWHPYWPVKALNDGNAKYHGAFDYNAFCRIDDPQELQKLFDLASKAGATLSGSWSVDLLETQRGWFVTDMAEAHKSWHWEGCVKRHHEKIDDPAKFVVTEIEQVRVKELESAHASS